MTEEVKIDLTDPNEPNNAPEVSAIELRAKELGWRPREEFNGEDDNFVDAKEFVHRQPLFEKIEHQSRELRNVKKSLDALKGHYTAVRETEYQRALAQLQATKINAINEADGARVVDVDNQIAEAQRKFQEIKNADIQDSAPPDPAEFISWKAKNAWYEKDESMRMFADTFGERLSRQGMSPAEVLSSVSKKVREEFPHKFVNPNKASAPDVGVSGNTGRASSSERFELTDVERSIMNTLVRDGTMTKEKYIADLKAIKASRG